MDVSKLNFVATMLSLYALLYNKKQLTNYKQSIAF